MFLKWSPFCIWQCVRVPVASRLANTWWCWCLGFTHSNTMSRCHIVIWTWSLHLMKPSLISCTCLTSVSLLWWGICLDLLTIFKLNFLSPQFLVWRVYFVDLGYESFSRYVFCKCFIPTHGFSPHFLNIALHRAGILNFNEIPLINLCSKVIFGVVSKKFLLN